jgi:CheY-like chemotaxis protein
MSHADEAVVMVVGADSDFCYLMRRYLRKASHLRVVTLTQEEALARAAAEQPAAIVLEADSPGPGCWDTLHALKATRATRHIPVVVCSWLDVEQRSLDAGADRFLRKPVLYEDLVAVLVDLGIRPATHTAGAA